ncbi:MAG: hypothetical protein PHN39_01765, partial [Candidatus Pacebacteria bacterium]|nr:hypothetical protein [Candidatus Paceibacterota bacterium]
MKKKLHRGLLMVGKGLQAAFFGAYFGLWKTTKKRQNILILACLLISALLSVKVVFAYTYNNLETPAYLEQFSDSFKRYRGDFEKGVNKSLIFLSSAFSRSQEAIYIAKSNSSDNLVALLLSIDKTPDFMGRIFNKSKGVVSWLENNSAENLSALFGRFGNFSEKLSSVADGLSGATNSLAVSANLKDNVGSLFAASKGRVQQGVYFILKPWLDVSNQSNIVSLQQENQNILEGQAKEAPQQEKGNQSKLNQSTPIIIKEVIKESDNRDDNSSQALKNLESQMGALKQQWGMHNSLIQELSQKVYSYPSSTPTYSAPVYVASQGFRSDGLGMFSNLGVEGSASVKDLSVAHNTSLGQDSLDKFDVRATSGFLAPVTVGKKFTAGNLISDPDLNSVLVTATGSLSALGNFSVGTTSVFEKLNVIAGRVYLDATSAPAETTNRLYNLSGDLYWNGSLLSSSGGSGTNYWGLSGTNLYTSSTSYQVAIGTTTPTSLFELWGLST